jgi:signal transduction histidine kinase
MGLAVFDGYNQQRQAAMQEIAWRMPSATLALAQRLAALEQSYQQVEASARQREEGVKDTVHDLRQPMHALRLSLRQMFDALSRDKAADASSDRGGAWLHGNSWWIERLADTAQAERHSRAAALKAPGTVAGEPGLHAVLRGSRRHVFLRGYRPRDLSCALKLAAPDAKTSRPTRSCGCSPISSPTPSNTPVRAA